VKGVKESTDGIEWAKYLEICEFRGMRGAISVRVGSDSTISTGTEVLKY
jgi:hypothetical protein